MKNKNILIVGVGGQGTILTAKILTDAILSLGLEIKMSEIHGMSQRGGDVKTEVRFGKNIFSPTLSKGDVDIILAFEELEALRHIDYLKKDGIIIVNEQKIDPMPVLTGDFSYPNDIMKKLSKYKLYKIDAKKIADTLNNQRVINIVMLGVMSNFLKDMKIDFKKSIKKLIKKEQVNTNLKAFDLGKNFVQVS